MCLKIGMEIKTGGGGKGVEGLELEFIGWLGYIEACFTIIFRKFGVRISGEEVTKLNSEVISYKERVQSLEEELSKYNEKITRVEQDVKVIRMEKQKFENQLTSAKQVS